MQAATGVDISRTRTVDGGPRTVKRGEFDEIEMAHVAFFKRN